MSNDGIRFGKVRREDIQLDSAGLSAILTGPRVTAMVQDAAHSIATAAESYIPRGSTYYTISNPKLRGRVEITYYTANGGRLVGNRAAALVVLAFVRGAAIETRYGPLRKSAAAQGIPVHRKRSR